MDGSANEIQSMLLEQKCKYNNIFSYDNYDAVSECNVHVFDKTCYNVFAGGNGMYVCIPQPRMELH